MRIFLFGYPGFLGGANTEAWHTIRLWKQGGIDVQVIPTWGHDRLWKRRLDAIGVPTYHVARQDVASVPGLEGNVCVGFCNTRFLEVAPALRKLDCSLVWVNCMTWTFPEERIFYDRHGLCDAMVFQSDFQRSLLEPELRPFGYQSTQGHRIRGAFCTEEWAFAPRALALQGEYCVGRLARPDLDKWPSDLWETYAKIGYRPLKARVMGWDSRVAGKCGEPPEWGETLAPLKEEAAAFIGSLHCLVTVNGGARENWPRIGLEAMASGVPVVAENCWGWTEMIEHGVTGFLADSGDEVAHYATVLAMDASKRMEIAQNARRRLEQDLANPQELCTQWRHLFAKVTAER
jgi:hypothetical protein